MNTGTKIGLGVAGGAVVLIGGRYIYRKVTRGKASNETIAATQTEAQQILKNNAHLPSDQQIRATATPAQMKIYANKLKKAMQGAGTDDDAVKDVASKINNDLDFLLLVDSFGVQDDDDLATWLEDDGATEEFNAVLETKANVTKRF